MRGAPNTSDTTDAPALRCPRCGNDGTRGVFSTFPVRRPQGRPTRKRVPLAVSEHTLRKYVLSLMQTQLDETVVDVNSAARKLAQEPAPDRAQRLSLLRHRGRLLKELERIEAMIALYEKG